MRRSFFSAFFAIAIISLTYGCGSGSNKSINNNPHKLDEKSKKYIENLSRPDQEIVALLAIKYKLEPQLTEMLVDEYLFKG